MDNNDVLRRIRYTFDFGDAKVSDLFSLGGKKVTRAEISNWLKKEEHPDFEEMEDVDLAVFLNGLIADKRGKREGAPEPKPERTLTNNLIFRKLKIALSLKDEDLVSILKLAGFPTSKHEVNAFFRRPDHRNYRECQDQVLRYFLKGMQLKYRENSSE